MGAVTDEQQPIIFGMSHADIARLICRVMVLLLIQGITLMVLYSVRGFDANPDDMPPGFGLDPLHSVIHLLWGLGGAYVGFFMPRWSIRYLQAFSIFYLGLAILGSFTHVHFGMQLEAEENAFHWPLSLIALALAFGPLLLNRKAN